MFLKLLFLPLLSPTNMVSAPYLPLVCVAPTSSFSHSTENAQKHSPFLHNVNHSMNEFNPCAGRLPVGSPAPSIKPKLLPKAPGPMTPDCAPPTPRGLLIRPRCHLWTVSHARTDHWERMVWLLVTLTLPPCCLCRAL
jgi:hypothetical protein